MRKEFRPLALAALISCGLGRAAAPGHAAVSLDGVHVTYHEGALIQHVRVAPLFYGSSWRENSAPAYLKGFLKALFDDGRFMANLSQYGTPQLPIENGSAVNPVLDPAELPKAKGAQPADAIQYQVSDAQIRSEIKAQIAAGKLPAPDTETLYLVCTPPDVVVIKDGANSLYDFSGYHDYDPEGGFTYALVALSELPDSLVGLGMTQTTSHELAEAVTDPQPELQAFGEGGWYDDRLGEIGDIVTTLAGLGFVDSDDLYDVLTGANGTEYLVQKVWSNQDQAPVAFAPAAPTRTVTGAGPSGPAAPTTVQPTPGAGPGSAAVGAPATTWPGRGSAGHPQFRYGRLAFTASHYGRIVLPALAGDPYGSAEVRSPYLPLPYRYGRLLPLPAPGQENDNIGPQLAASQATAGGTSVTPPEGTDLPAPDGGE